MKSFFIKISKVNTLIHSLSSFGLSIVYTIGHIIIAWACATIIFQTNFFLASADAIIEPIINGFWFFLLHMYAHDKLKPALLAVIYTIGHFIIAITVLMLVADVSFMIALTDAIVEPLANTVWYFLLDKFWASKVASK